MKHDKPLLTVDQLINEYTFEYAGHWRFCSPNKDGHRIEFTYQNEHATGVYAYCVDGVVTYIGNTTNSLHKMFYYFANVHISRSTHVRIHELIDAALDSGQRAEIYIFITDDKHEMKELESKILETYNIIWRIRGALNTA